MTQSRILDLTKRVDNFDFTFDGYTLAGTWFKWRTTSPSYQRRKAEKIAALPTVPENTNDAEAEKILAQIEKAIREINAQVMADTIASWDAVEDWPRTLTKDQYEEASERRRKAYKLASNAVVVEPGQDADADLTYELIDPTMADGPRPVPLVVEVFEELPGMFNRALGEYFQKLREETLNPTKSDSSQSG